MAPSPTKRAKLTKNQHNIKDLFAKSAFRSNTSIVQRKTEEEELEWAISESLKDQIDERKNTSSSLASVRSIENDILPLKETQPVNLSDRLDDDKTIEQKGSIQDAEAFRGSAIDLHAPLPSSNHPSTGNLSTTEFEQNGLCSSLTPTPQAKSHSNAFSKLMSTHSEAKEWAMADVVESRNYTGAARSRPQRRTAPFYKVLTGMPISVDAFRFGEIEGCSAYFLSHFHADHYGGMTSVWNHGPIYCSVTTANLVRSSLRVQDQYVCPLPMNETITIPRTGGVRVTLLDANHCPGSCVFLFEGPQTCHILPASQGFNHPPLPPSTKVFRYLHCGDFRASPRHVNHPSMKGKRLDIIYLDTTYCNPRYCFPAQEMVVNACARIVQMAAPEQCRIGQLSRSNALNNFEEDWRNSPTRSKRSDPCQTEEEHKSASALRQWLTPSSIDAERSVDKIKDETVVKCEVEEKEEDLYHELDFHDETYGISEELEEYGNRDSGMKEEATSEIIEEAPEVPDESVALIAKHEDQDSIMECSSIREKSGKNLASSSTADHPCVLIVVGTYTIGKEKIVMACAKALGTRIYCADPRKYRVYAQLDDGELHSLLTRDPLQAYVHVTSLMNINGDSLQEHSSKMRSLGMRIDRSIAFRPTGWTYRPPAGMDTVSPSLERLINWNQGRTFGPSYLTSTRDSTMKHTIYGVPYSEHSSFFELTAFCLSVDYDRIIATVNVGNPNSRNKMARWFEKWKAEKKRRNGERIEPRSEDFF